MFCQIHFLVFAPSFTNPPHDIVGSEGVSMSSVNHFAFISMSKYHQCLKAKTSYFQFRLWLGFDTVVNQQSLVYK